MAVTLWMMLLWLLVRGSFCSEEQKGCMKWSLDKNNERNVCCDICHPGNRLVRNCGPSPKDLCTPCETQRFTVQPKDLECSPCTQCEGAQVLLKECTPTSDTVCGCKKGSACGNTLCSVCVTACSKGQEPSENSGCRACPNGTFNDKIHEKCKPWSTRCQEPNQKIIAMGDAFSDIKCEDVTDAGESPSVWSLMSSLNLIILIVLIILITLIIIFSVSLKLQQKRKKTEMPEKVLPESPVIGTPTDNDDHMTLIAIECSFHEAEQEQGSSLESLTSESSTKELID